MNTPEISGESSCKRQEDGDISAGSERPLKKARFAWQVKGRYRLKNDTAEPATSSLPPAEPERVETSAKNSDSNLVASTEQNLEILGDYLLKQDFNTLDSMITDSDKSLLKPCCSNVAAEPYEYGQYVPSESSNKSNSSFSNEHISIPMSMVVSHNYSEDQCIARWQARQMAKGFVDNTINRVIDSWMVARLSPDIQNSGFLALDVAEFINNLPGDNSIENEGILMAISAHGLQSASSSSSSNETNHSEMCSLNTKDDHFLSSPSSPLHSEDEGVLEPSDNKTEADESIEVDMPWSHGDNVIRKDNDSTPFGFYPDMSNSSYHYFSENEVHMPKIEYDENISSGVNDISSPHFDFMDAAVTFAIQNKGLTSFGADYG